MSSLITALTGFIQNLYVSTGLIGIVLAMAIESCCIPLPSEIIMPLAGSMLAMSSAAGAKHMLGVNPASPLWLNLVLMALAGSLGSLLGSLLAYGIGYAGGRPLMLKYGRYVLISQHDADKADAFFQRWGSATAFFSRMMPVVRTYISLPAGITKMNAIKFSIYTFLGSLPWCLLLAFLGYQLGNHYEQISGPLHYADGVIAVLVVALVVWYVWRHIRNDRRARAEHAAAELVAAEVAGTESARGANTPWGQQSPFQVQGQQSQPGFAGQPAPFQNQSSPSGFQGQRPPQFSGQGQPSQPGFQGQQPPFQSSSPQWGQPQGPGQQGGPGGPQQGWGQPQGPQQWGPAQSGPQSWGQPQGPGQQGGPGGPQQGWGQAQPTPSQWGRPVAPSQPQPPQSGNPGPGNGWQR